MLANPRSISSWRRDLSSIMRSMAAARPSVSNGSIKSAASPATSGRELVLLQMTGVPQAIASRIGKPNPSYSEGKTKAAAPDKSAALSLSGI